MIYRGGCYQYVFTDPEVLGVWERSFALTPSSRGVFCESGIAAYVRGDRRAGFRLLLSDELEDHLEPDQPDYPLWPHA